MELGSCFSAARLVGEVAEAAAQEEDDDEDDEGGAAEVPARGGSAWWVAAESTEVAPLRRGETVDAELPRLTVDASSSRGRFIDSEWRRGAAGKELGTRAEAAEAAAAMAAAGPFWAAVQSCASSRRVSRATCARRPLASSRMRAVSASLASSWRRSWPFSSRSSPISARRFSLERVAAARFFALRVSSSSAGLERGREGASPPSAVALPEDAEEDDVRDAPMSRGLFRAPSAAWRRAWRGGPTLLEQTESDEGWWLWRAAEPLRWRRDTWGTTPLERPAREAPEQDSSPWSVGVRVSRRLPRWAGAAEACAEPNGGGVMAALAAALRAASRLAGRERSRPDHAYVRESRDVAAGAADAAREAVGAEADGDAPA
mmetsp:Transcript_393/g.1392  ORF Transcript_393/g.1392 Transcript_393/m.1392 type:complete len:374 (+) Transcript_393:982-2103(+)